MKNIKLLLIAPSFYPVHGGAGLRFYRYLPYFNEHNVETTVVCGTPKSKKFTDEDRKADWLQFQDGTLVDEAILSGARVLKYKIPGKGSKQRSNILLEKAIGLCAQEATKPDIVHIIAPMPFCVIDQLKIIKKFGVKLVYSHTIAKDFSNNILVKFLQKWKISQIYKQYDHILVQSNVISEMIKGINSKSKISVIPNGVDTKKFSPIKNLQEKNNLRTSLGLPANSTILILVGAVHPRKGTDILVDAWSQLVSKHPTLNLLLVGPRYDLIRDELAEFKHKIDCLVKYSNHSSNIHFLGQSDQVDLYLKASDIFVFTSYREGMPNSVLEAMSTGLAVILTEFIGLSDDFGEPGKHFILANRKADELAETLNYLINSQREIGKLGRRARELIVNTIGIDECVNSHMRLYKEL